MLRHPFLRVDFALEFWFYLWARGVLGVVSPSFDFNWLGTQFTLTTCLTHSLCVRMHFPLTTHSPGVCTLSTQTTLFLAKLCQFLGLALHFDQLLSVVFRSDQKFTLMWGVSLTGTLDFLCTGRGSGGILGGWGLRNPPHWRTFTQTLVNYLRNPPHWR